MLPGSLFDIDDDADAHTGNTQSSSTTVTSSLPKRMHSYERQDSNTLNETVLIIRSTSLDDQICIDRQPSQNSVFTNTSQSLFGGDHWGGPEAEILGKDHYFEVDMPDDIDAFIITSHLGNEKLLSKEFPYCLELVAKQMAVHKEAKEITDNNRNQCLDILTKLLDVVHQQMRSFKECQDCIDDAR